MGRTARFSQAGKSLLYIDPTESKFVEKLLNKKYIIKEIRANPNKIINI